MSRRWCCRQEQHYPHRNDALVTADYLVSDYLGRRQLFFLTLMAYSMDYVKIATIEEFSSKRHKTARLLGKLVGVIKRRDGSFFAVEAACKHQGADLLSDYRGGGMVSCPRHQWEYDLESGHCLTHDSPPLRRYGLKIEGSNILVSLRPLSQDTGRT